MQQLDRGNRYANRKHVNRSKRSMTSARQADGLCDHGTFFDQPA
jgi:hypothetical protein